MNTFKKLQEDALRYFDLASETEGADIDLVKQAINNAHQTRVSTEHWKFMLSSVHTLEVVTGQQEYILPHENFNIEQYLWSSTNKKFAQRLPMREVPYVDIGFAQQQTNNDNKYYDVQGASPVKRQPSTPATLTIIPVGSEPTNPGLYIEGEDEDGDFISETVDSTQPSSQEFAKVTYVAKTADWTSQSLTLLCGSTILLTLSSTEYAKQYPIVKFHNIPSADETFIYRYFRKPRVLSRDFDIPDIPYPTSGILVYDALLDLATFNELDSESVNLWREKRDDWMAQLYTEKLEADVVAGLGSSIVETSKL